MTSDSSAPRSQRWRAIAAHALITLVPIGLIGWLFENLDDRGVLSLDAGQLCFWPLAVLFLLVGRTVYERMTKGTWLWDRFMEGRRKPPS